MPAPPTASATITGKTGPGLTVTAIALPNITFFSLDIPKGVLTVVSNGITSTWDYTQTTTLTDTISGTVSTFVVS